MDSSKSNKLFRDSVHGYIAIPNRYCKHFIDSPQFQRLRRIEQTSIRVLFPSARHDRFIHSIGVFHLGRLAISQIERNSEEVQKFDNKEWEKLKTTFYIACLLHDIGHTPFSHTFEHHLDKDSRLDKELSDLLSSEFAEDIKEKGHSQPHERASAIILLEKFGETMKNCFHALPSLAVRMIIGLPYTKEKLSDKERISNCLIRLLNSRTIDVDRLDYLSRDAWASGYNPGSIDIKRILASISIKPNGEDLQLVFHKSALSQIVTAFNVKNSQNYWLFTHHKVIYEQEILKRSVERLAQKLLTDEEDKEKCLAKLFNVDNFCKESQIGNYTIHLPTDDDIIFLLKSHINSIPHAKEFLHRKHRLKPLWKTYPEFCSLFYGEDKLEKEEIKQDGPLHQKIKATLKELFPDLKVEDDCILLKVNHKFVPMPSDNSEEDDMFIDFGDKIQPYDRLGLPFKIKKPEPFFICFIKKDLLEKKEEIVKSLIERVQSCRAKESPDNSGEHHP